MADVLAPRLKPTGGKYTNWIFVGKVQLRYFNSEKSIDESCRVKKWIIRLNGQNFSSTPTWIFFPIIQRKPQGYESEFE